VDAEPPDADREHPDDAVHDELDALGLGGDEQDGDAEEAGEADDDDDDVVPGGVAVAARDLLARAGSVVAEHVRQQWHGERQAADDEPDEGVHERATRGAERHEARDGPDEDRDEETAADRRHGSQATPACRAAPAGMTCRDRSCRAETPSATTAGPVPGPRHDT